MRQNRIYNSRLIDFYLKLIKAKYPHVNINQILKSANMESYEVADQGLWFTQEQVNQFYSAVVQLTGNENIAREAGRYAASPDTLGTMRKYMLSALSPEKAFGLLSKVTENLTKSANYSTRMVGPNAVEVTVRLREGIKEEPYQCQNRIGCFEAIVSSFNYKAPQITHEECLFEGGNECRYTIRWQPSSTALIKKSRDIFAVSATLLNIVLAFVSPAKTISMILPGSLIGLLGLNWALEKSRKQLTQDTLDQLRDSSEQLTEQINVNYRNTQLTREVGEAITSQSNIDDVISTVVKILEKTLDYDRGLILLANNETHKLEIRGGFGYSDQHLDLLENTSFHLDNPNSEGPFVVSYRQQKPILVNDAKEINATPRSRQFIEAIGTKSFLTVPIILEGQSIGIVAVDNKQREKPLVNSDVNLLMSIAPTIGISFRNAALNEARENQFAATLKVLAHSIDARDFLTAGHSEKVAEYAVEIAAELGKNHDYCQMIRVAALLHDYGKIGIPDTVLKKDGPLTEEERTLIQTHSQKSRDILQQVPFEGLYQEIPLIALHHHERWDGTGYPNGLVGRAIPYGARIIAVADFFEAITAKRHYREPMPTNVALDLVRKESGAHFDPQMTEAFLRYMNRNTDSDGSSPTVENGESSKWRKTRYNFQTKAEIEVAGLTIDGNTVDISRSGVFLKIDKSLAKQIKPHSTIQLSIAMPESRGVQLQGEVRWVNQEECQLSQRHPTGVGVAFLNIDQYAREVLDCTIQKLTRNEKLLFPHMPLLTPET